jgi:hypothetical protein
MAEAVVVAVKQVHVVPLGATPIQLNPRTMEEVPASAKGTTKQALMHVAMSLTA